VEQFKYILDNMRWLKERIDSCAEKAGRKPSEISLVVVAKNRSFEEVKEAVIAGARHIGENRVREAEKKYLDTDDERKFLLRMVGHLQRNKVAKAVKLFDTVDSVDSPALAETLSGELGKQDRVMPVQIEVNISGEETKSGFSPEALSEVIPEIVKCKNLKVEGLMTIGPLTEDAQAIRSAFRRMKDLYDNIGKEYSGIKELSMGMTDDFEVAIEEGSTMIRIGRAVFERR